MTTGMTPRTPTLLAGRYRTALRLLPAWWPAAAK